MALKYFLIYIGGSLACTIILIACTKKLAPGIAGSLKKAIFWGILLSLIAAGAAYLCTLMSNNLFEVFWIFTGIFLLFGIVHKLLDHKKYFYSGKDDHNKVFFGELLFSLALVFFSIIAFSCFEYFFKDKSFLFFPMLMSALAFFLPLLLAVTFEAAYNIPQPVFNHWSYPNSPIDFPDIKPTEKVLVVAFEVPKKFSDVAKTNFRARGPETMILGDLFYHFINDYNEVQSESSIEFSDKEYGPCEWWFRRKPKWYQRQCILDPELTLYKNLIKENTIITCERIQNP